MVVAERIGLVGKVADGQIARGVALRQALPPASAVCEPCALVHGIHGTRRWRDSGCEYLVLEGIVAFSSPWLRRKPHIRLEICFPSSLLRRRSPG